SFKPSSQLAGDFVDVFRLDDQHLGLCVLDVSGHGIAAALLSVTASHLLARMASPQTGGGKGVPGTATPVVPPAQGAEALSKRFGEAAVGQPFTFLYGILGLGTGEFRFTSAGHPGPVYLPRDASPVQLEIAGFPIGVGTGRYKDQAVNLLPG